MFGWLAALMVALVYETYAKIKGKELMTDAMRRILDHPLLGPGIVGFVAGLVYHFFEGLGKVQGVQSR